VSAWARAGVRCVCVTANWWEHESRQKTAAGPKRLERVTIAGTARREDGTLLLRVIGHAGLFNAAGFRPIRRASQRQDVALFRHLLAPSPALHLGVRR